MQEDEDLDMGQFEVAAIEDHRIVGGEPQFYIQWADYPTLEWKTEEGLANCAELLNEYNILYSG